jgi:peptidoglycan/LPS O-acetylase OafA/YrhL
MRTFIGIEFSRGLAALMVMISHYAYMVTEGRTVLNFLWTGVDLFFVISGFVFAKLIISAKINLSYFFIRRFFRIYPLYFVALLIYFCLANSHSDKINYFIHHLFFLQTSTSKTEAFFFNPAFWSLPVEVEFYLLIPILGYFMRFKHSLLMIFIISLILKLVLILQSTAGEIDIYAILGVHLTGILPEFLIGVFLYQWVVYTHIHCSDLYFKRLLFSITLFFGLMSLLLLSLFFVWYGDNGLQNYKIFGGFYNLFCAMSYSLILFSLSFINHNTIPKYLTTMMITLGMISYPVYLLHNAIPKLVDLIDLNLTSNMLFLFCIMITLMVSFIFHKLIEEPSRIYGRKLSQKFR